MSAKSPCLIGGAAKSNRAGPLGSNPYDGPRSRDKENSPSTIKKKKGEIPYAGKTPTTYCSTPRIGRAARSGRYVYN